MDEKLNVPKGIKLIVAIVDRGKSEKITKIYKDNNITFQFICLGKGTANSEILDYLGLGETEKDVVLGTVIEEKVQHILQILTNEMQFNKPGNGIAFTIPITSVGGPITLQFISGLTAKKE
ncbi:hypothetical protein ABEP44_12820 [Cutibacterium acnes]